MNNNASERKPVVGLVTLLVIFAVLCLTILSILSYSTARYEKTLAQKNADAATAYYAADSWCTDVSNKLYSAWKTGGDLAAVTAEYGGTCESTAAGERISYVCAVDDARLLSVTITAGDAFTVEAWQTIPKNDWEADERLHVWNPQENAETSKGE